MTFGDWKHEQKETNTQQSGSRDASWYQNAADSPPTTFADWSVVLHIVLLAPAGAAADDPSPVDRVQVAELLVARDVDGAVVDVAQRAQAQRGQGGASDHHQRVEPGD